jgi:hypothetical protein
MAARAESTTFSDLTEGDCMPAGARVKRRLLLALVVGCFLCAPAFGLEQFPTEAAAQQHCPNDVVVWLNLPTMIWHYKGQRWYGNTKQGAYVCQREAAASGARATRNGE